MKYFLSLFILVYVVNANAQKLGTILQDVKQTTNTVKEVVHDVNEIKQPEQDTTKKKNNNQVSNNNPSDTVKQTTPNNGTTPTNNLAIGDQGTTDAPKGKSNSKKEIKPLKPILTTPPTSTPTNNLAIGDQGTSENPKKNTTKNNQKIAPKNSADSTYKTTEQPK